ncbi:MAG TPA: glycosyl hydrolase [Puia sp.]|nr:glycosyl hydrolase [Puia sp.]
MKPSLPILFLLFSFSAASSQPFQPVNKNASPEARQLLSYLYSIKGKYILSGEHNFNESMNRFSDSVKSITGKYPAVWGTDFIWNGTKDNGQAIVDESIRKHRQGYIVTLMWHPGRPTDDPPFGWKESVQGKLTDEEWKELVTPGTSLNKRWLAQIDVVAGYLQQLQAAHVPVLWRPYHEMNGVWFWWGNKKGTNGIQKLWKMMYDRYVNHFHLNNLLWVWGANGPRDIPGDEAYAYRDFYPGAGYVDILGADVYHMDYEQKDYNELLNLAKGKPIALTECGQLPNSAILDAQPEWVWFLVWTSFIYSNNSKRQVNEVYGRPQTLTHKEIP